MFDRIQGESLVVDQEHKPSLDAVHNAGLALGQLHTITEDVQIPHKRTRNIYTEVNRISTNKQKFAGMFEDGEDFAQKVATLTEELQSEDQPSGIIHNDFRPQNTLFKGDELQAVIDFDWSCDGHLIKDLGLALAEWSYPSGAPEAWEDVFDTMLIAYNKTAPHKIEKSDQLYRWIAFACLSDACTYFADVMEKTHTNDEKLKLRSYMYTKYKYFSSKIKNKNI